MDSQLLLLDEMEFTIENWRAEIQATADDFLSLRGHARRHNKELTEVYWRTGDLLLRAKENGVSNNQLENEVLTIFKREMPINTIWDYIRVSKRFRDHSRRRESLFWSHHKEVAIDEFSDAQQDQLLNEAEKRKLSVEKLRDRARALKKRSQKLVEQPGRGFKKVSVFLPTDTFKLLKKLAFARGYTGYRRNRTDLVAEIVGKYFNDNRDGIAKEVDEWWARVSKGRQEAKEALKQKKLQLEAAMAPRRPAFDHIKELITKTKRPDAGKFFSQYLKKEYGGIRYADLPIEMLDRVLAALKSAEGPEAQVALLKAMAEQPKS
jgi:hypothetical protein